MNYILILLFAFSEFCSYSLYKWGYESILKVCSFSWKNYTYNSSHSVQPYDNLGKLRCWGRAHHKPVKDWEICSFKNQLSLPQTQDNIIKALERSLSLSVTCCSFTWSFACSLFSWCPLVVNMQTSSYMGPRVGPKHWLQVRPSRWASSKQEPEYSDTELARMQIGRETKLARSRETLKVIKFSASFPALESEISSVLRGGVAMVSAFKTPGFNSRYINVDNSHNYLQPQSPHLFSAHPFW